MAKKKARKRKRKMNENTMIWNEECDKVDKVQQRSIHIDHLRS